MSDCALDEMSPFEKMILLHVSADYSWTDAGIVRIGESGDLAACAVGDFKGRCLIFCHGNGETAVSERYWFERLAAAVTLSVMIPYSLFSRDEPHWLWRYLLLILTAVGRRVPSPPHSRYNA